MRRVMMIAVLRFVGILLLSAYSLAPSAQGVQTLRPNVPINSNCNGFIEYLPQGYSGNTNRYPLIIFIGGMGTTGDGSLAQLENLFSSGGGFPHEQIRAGNWQDAYTVNGQTHRFIIFTPQFKAPYWQRAPTPEEVNDVINYAVANYRVDPTRIYLTGNSSGGGPVWDYIGASSAYAGRIAAALPFCGAAIPSQTKANNMRNSNVAVWAFHNEYDPGVPASFTKDFVRMINTPTPATPPAKQTIFPYDGHDCWWNAFMRVHTEGGLNIYQWMLQYQQKVSNAKAGLDQEINLPATSAQLSGSGTGPNGSASSFSWSKVSGPSGGSFSNPSSASTTISGLQQGTYILRLTITDNAGGTATDDVAIVVNPPSIRIEAERFTSMQGVQVENTGDAGGGQNVFSIDNGDWMDYSINVSTAGPYVIKFRVASFVAGGQLQVKNAAGTVLATQDVYNTGAWQTYWTLEKTITLPAGQQTLRIQSSAAPQWNINWFEVMGGTTTGNPTNQLPVSNAGSDQTITLPANSVQLNGSGTDADGTIASYNWSMVTGPSTPTFSNASAASTTAGNLVAGTYTFRLTVTDNAGGSHTDDVVVTVNNATPATGRIQAEAFTGMQGIQVENTQDAGGGQNVGYIDNGDWMEYTINPATTGTYTANFRIASDMAGAQVQVRKTDGTVLATLDIPRTGGWQTWQTASTTIQLTQGVQTIRLVSANWSSWNINWFEFIAGGTPTNQQPVANAGTDKAITLPTNSVVLSGTGSDPDGTITSYSWTKQSGPAGETLANANTASATAQGLVAGTYVFRLTVTDNGGATNFDEVTVVVNPAAPSGSSIHIEAEAWTAMFGVQTENTGDAGGGQNVGYIDNGDWMDYSINPATSGSYTASFRVTSPASGGRLELRKQDGTVLASVNIPTTGGWQNWQTVTVPVTLSAGAQTIRVISVTYNGFNINWLRFDGSGTPGNTQPTANAGADKSITLPANSVVLSGSGADSDGSISAYSWTQVSGPSTATIQSPSSAQTTISNLAQGSYTFQLKVTDNAGAVGTDDVIVVVNASTPSGNTIRVQAEAFTSMQGIQVENTQDVDGVQNVGYIDNGDWMDYSINPSTSGTYTANFRVASDMTGAQVQVRKPDGTILATITLPRTGGWQTWQTVSTTLNLTQGQQTIRLVSSNWSSWNINWFELVSGATPPPPVTTSRVEAEAFTSMTGVQTENTGDAGGGQNVGYIDNGDWMDYAVSVPSATTYTMNFRIATPMSGAQLQVRNASGNVLATVNLPATGGWQTWQTVSASVPLASGSQTIRIVSSSAANWNFNWMEIVVPAGSNAITSRSVTEATLIVEPFTTMELYPNPANDRTMLKLGGAYTGNIRVQVVSMNGAVQRTFNLNKGTGQTQFPVQLSGLMPGEYILVVQTNEGRQTKKFIKL